MIGVHFRSGPVFVARWGEAVEAVPGTLTYRGDRVRLGPPTVADVSDLSVSPLRILREPDHCRAYFALLARQLPTLGVVAVPDAGAATGLHAVLAGAGLPVVRVVGAPAAAIAYAHATGALRQAPLAAPTVVCDVDDGGATVTMLEAAPHVLRPGAATWVAAPAGMPDRAGVIGRAVAAAHDDHLRLIVVGDPDLSGAILAATRYRRRAPVHLVRLPGPAHEAVAAGAAAIAAGQVTVEDRCRYGVSLAAHVTDFDTLTDRWPELAGPHAVATGGRGAAVEVDVADGQDRAVVRLIRDDGTARDVEVALAPPVAAGTYAVSLTVTAAGPALSFDRPGGSAVFGIPAPGEAR